MDSDSFDAKMREGAYFHNLRILPGAWVVIRVDGRGFSKFTESRFGKPFDLKFHEMMAKTTKVLLQEVQKIYAHTESNESSILCAPNCDFFDRSLEKAVSISAGIASSTFTHLCQSAVSFNSRVWLGVNKSQVVDYFRWRQADAA